MKRALALVLPLLMLVRDLPACSVCFGDPKSPLTIGAKAGVFFLLGVIGCVVAGIFSVAVFWMRRAKLLEAQSLAENPEGRGPDVAESI